MVSGGRADAGDLPGPQQVLRGRWPRRRCQRRGLGRNLGSYGQGVRTFSAKKALAAERPLQTAALFLRAFFALRDGTGLCRTAQRFAIRTDGLGRAVVSHALLHERGLRSAGERLAVL